MTGGTGSVFTIGAIDISPLVDTITANAPTIITAGISITLVIAAFNLVPKMIKKNVKGA